MLAAKISTTKDSIDDGGQYKSVLVEDPPANISKQSTELIQQHIEPRTSSNNQNYYLSSNEKELAAVPYSSNINTDSNSLQQYYKEGYREHWTDIYKKHNMDLEKIKVQQTQFT